jgi:hypothetical protein
LLASLPCLTLGWSESLNRFVAMAGVRSFHTKMPKL